jgi:hypothetical protein
MRAMTLGLTAGALLTLIACTGKDSVDIHDSEGLSTDDSEVETDDSDGSIDTIEGTLQGNVKVQLYTTGEDGEREMVSWEDSTCGDTYAFGKVFVTAWHDNDSGGRKWIGQDTIDSPSTEGDDYSFDVSFEGSRTVYIYAQVDYWGDRVVGSDDPVGNYTGTVDLEDGETLDGLDITILVPECYGGGGSCDTVGITGDAIITSSYAGGDIAVMLAGPNGEGPYHVTWNTPDATAGGAEANYSLTTCAGYGDTQLLGAWDKNGNELADPMDKWGAYISEVDVDGNPISIESSNLVDYDIQIPLGEYGLSVVPFVTLSGTVDVSGGEAFDSLGGGTLYVAAMKYRPSGDVAVASLEAGDAYDIAAFEPGDLAGQTSVDFRLDVPGNTIAYLWAYLDEDNNGVLNEVGEALGSGGLDSTGRIPTGTTSSSSNDITIIDPPEEEE